ncbi:MAG TPA: hypothetical protein VM537_36875, partial [Anaerolineae bacterium]|nr:hypothetical protein [Anaerolineae bacterium]
ASLIGRPAQLGHIGEFIASQVFGIVLEESASRKAIDGHFAGGPLAGRTVDIKWYGRQEGILDISPSDLPDYYLVLAGPKSAASSSRGGVRPWTIVSAHLFDASELADDLRRRGLKVGVASSLCQVLWQEAEIHPQQRNCRLVLTPGQLEMLALFAPPDGRTP